MVNKRIRVMHIVQAAGGVDRYLYMLLKNMNASKYENILVCSFDYEKEKYSKYVDQFIYVEMKRNINAINDLKCIFAVRKIIKKYRPDIIYAHSSKAGAIGRISNIGINNSTIYNPHGWSFDMQCNKIRKLFYLMVEHILALFTTKIIAISQYEYNEAIINHVCNSKKLTLINNGIDLEELNNKKNVLSESFIPKNAYVIGMVGRISAQKAPDTFIKVASKIKEKIKNAYFIIVGDGCERSNIETLIKRFGLQDDVKITGWVNNPTDYIATFDQALLLSRWEGFGLVLLEYMYEQKPIIATNAGAIPFIIQDMYNGIITEIDNVDQIVDSIYRIYNDKDLRTRFVNNGISILREKYTINRVVDQHEKLFDKILKINKR